MQSNLAFFEDVSNPLDSVEEFLSGNDWVFNRPNPEELTVTVTGRANAIYRLTFLWQEEFSAMQFFCEYDIRIAKERQDMAGRALRTINERLWLGHFDVPETGMPCFRHTSLFRGMTQSSGAEHLEDLVEIALAECERHQNIFNMLASSLYLDADIMMLVLSDDAGQA
jgi:hypothetical protein